LNYAVKWLVLNLSTRFGWPFSEDSRRNPAGNSSLSTETEDGDNDIGFAPDESKRFKEEFGEQMRKSWRRSGARS